jgi:hypothetical protein
MKKYFNLFDHIETLYNNFNLDITHAENMLKFYMQNYDGGIDTFVDSIKYKRIK